MNDDPMLRSILRKTLRDQRRALIGWGIAFAGLALMMTAIWPSMAGQSEQLNELAASYPEVLQAIIGDLSDIATPAGFLDAELFGLMYPIMLLVYMIGRGSDLIAGEEERGVLDILLSHPVSRRRVFFEKAGALALGALSLMTITWVALTLGSIAFGLDISPLRLAGGLLMLTLLGLVFGALSMMMGAARGRRGVAIATASALAVATYLIVALSRLVTQVEWVRYVSPFYYYGAAKPLVNAPDVGHVVLFLATIAALLAFGVWRFERRDLGV